MSRSGPRAGFRTPLHRDNWQTSRLKFLLKKENRPVLADDGVVTAFRDGVVTLRSNRREEGFTFAEKEIGYQGVEPGDLVVHAMDGFAGAIGVSDSRGKCSPVCSIVTPLSTAPAVTRFWGYYLRNLAVTGFITSLAKGIRERSTDFRWNDVANLLVNFPDVATQTAIADFLDRETQRIADLVRKRQEILALLQERTSSIVASTVAPLLIDGQASSPTWFAALPESWRARRAKFLFRERQSRSVTGGEELLSVSHLTGVTRRAEKEVYMFLAETNEGYKLVFNGDIVINTMWAWMGAIGVSQLDGLISPSYGVYFPITDDYNPAYLDLLLRSAPFVAEVIRRSKGIHSSRLRLYPGAFLDTLMPIPPKDVQQQLLANYQSRTVTQRRLAQLNQQSIDRLTEFRAALVTAAVTGQIDVSKWRKRGETDRHIERLEELP